MTKRVLTIDGGGIRGIIPAKVLVAIEDIKKKPIAQLFDLIAGTSTGGILAAGLCVPDGSGMPKFAATDLLDLYRVHGKEIFATNPLRKISSLLVGPEYSAGPLEALLKNYLQDARLKDAVTGLLITAYDMRKGEAWFFSRTQLDANPDRNYLLRHIARATSAAPTYFSPVEFPFPDVVPMPSPTAGTPPVPVPAVLVDGGVFANNPSMCAWVDGHENVEASEDVLILSLGTGSVPHPYTFSRARRWGKMLWAQPAIGAFLDGQSDTTEYQMQKLLDSDHYLRLQAQLDVVNESMDNTNPTNLKALEEAADRMMADPANSAKLAAFVNKL